MDDFTYNYNGLTNQLNHIDDSVAASGNTDDLDTQSPNNYEYNSIGQLVVNHGEDVKYTYNASGLVTQIKNANDSFVMNIYYDDKGQRVRKESTTDSGGTWYETYYVRDTSGKVMAIYQGAYGNNSQTIVVQEYPIYGNSRIGIYNKPNNMGSY